jgi:hypothetical protein
LTLKLDSDILCVSAGKTEITRPGEKMLDMDELDVFDIPYPDMDELTPYPRENVDPLCACGEEMKDMGDGNWVCWECEYPSDECVCEMEDDGSERFHEYHDDDDYLIDGVGFEYPGANSALRRATPSNPRNLPCPTCGQPDRLTPLDRARGYQCDSCADRAERGWDY